MANTFFLVFILTRRKYGELKSNYYTYLKVYFPNKSRLFFKRLLQGVYLAECPLNLTSTLSSSLMVA